MVIEYLDTLHEGPRLYPDAWPDRLTALRRHAQGQGMLDAALLLLSEGFRPAERRSEPHMSLWTAKLLACVDSLEKEDLGTGPFTIGQLAIGVALSYLDFRFAHRNWRDGHPALAAWHATFNARPPVLANAVVDDR